MCKKGPFGAFLRNGQVQRLVYKSRGTAVIECPGSRCRTPISRKHQSECLSKLVWPTFVRCRESARPGQAVVRKWSDCVFACGIGCPALCCVWAVGWIFFFFFRRADGWSWPASSTKSGPMLLETPPPFPCRIQSAANPPRLEGCMAFGHLHGLFRALSSSYQDRRESVFKIFAHLTLQSRPPLPDLTCGRSCGEGRRQAHTVKRQPQFGCAPGDIPHTRGPVVEY